MKNIVFLIEDELDIMYIYKTALKAVGINLEPIATGREAVEKIKKVQDKIEEKPVLVLLDLILPDINGLEILNIIRGHKVTRDIPVFILSNYNSDALQNMQYIKADRAFLKTTITPSQLADVVKDQIGAETPEPVIEKPIIVKKNPARSSKKKIHLNHEPSK